MSRTMIDQTVKENQGTYEDTSYYLPKGSKNSHRTIDSRLQNQRPSDDMTNPSFQFEMKFDSLKNYVDSITTAVNQHASLLNKLRAEINLRVVEKNLSETINKFADCITIKDLDPSFMITAVNENGDSKEEGGSLNSSVTNFCQKLEIFGSGFSKVNKIGQTINGKMQEMENSLAKKMSGADLKEKVKKAKTKLRGEADNNNKKLDEKIKAVEKRWLEKYETMERRLNRMDQDKTTGNREQDSEDLIKKTDLSNITRELEEKIMREMNQVIEKNSGVKQEEMTGLNAKVQALEESVNRQIVDIKKAVDEVNASLTKQSQPLKQEDIEKEIKKHMAQEIKTVKLPFEESCNQLKQQVEAIKSSIENLDTMKQKSETNFDLQKFTEIEQTTTKAKTEIDRLNQKMNELSKSLAEKNKLDTVRSKGEQPDLTNISEFMQVEEQNHKRITKTIEDLEQKVDKVNQNFDRKTAKLKKEFDLDSLIKQFRSKADEGYVQKNFENFEAKIAGLGENFVLLKREIDAMTKGNYHPSKPNDNAFISIKGALPKACLSCGNSGPIHQISSSFMAKKSEKAHLRERDSSLDRPSTANTLKMKVITGSTMMANMTTTQGFGITPLKLSAARQDSFK